MMGFGGGLGMFFGPLFLIGLVVLVVYLVSGSSDTKLGLGRLTQQKTPLDILDDRLARGDIDRREYDEKRQVLNL